MHANTVVIDMPRHTIDAIAETPQHLRLPFVYVADDAADAVLGQMPALLELAVVDEVLELGLPADGALAQIGLVAPDFHLPLAQFLAHRGEMMSTRGDG